MLPLWIAFALPLADEPVKTVFFTLTFKERSPHSSPAEVTNRVGPKGVKKADDYDLEKESFAVYVPENYTGKKAFGLLVFVSPNGNGDLKGFDRNDDGWSKALYEREIIWVGPNKAGNDRPVLPRLGLSLDAAHNMPKQFDIDPERIYIGGVSGGGRITSWLLLPFPDVFTGGYSIIGADFYKNLPSKEQQGVYAGTFKAPGPKLLGQARKHRYVLLTGDADPNREQMQVIHQTLKKDGWQKVFYFQVPRMGHSAPNGEWFAKGLAALDGERE